MLSSAKYWKLNSLRLVGGRKDSRFTAKILGLLLLIVLIAIEFAPFNSQQANAQSHTTATVNNGCTHLTFSGDGNPFPLCPGTYPTGGNCVWWAWEQWHWLGYDLPLNWGNAADWVVDAERSGLPLGRVPRVGSIAVFPVGDGVWAYGPEGHVAFVTSVSTDGGTFSVTYQNYGDPHYMYMGTGYNVSYINQPRFQNGAMRFIYFPGGIDANRFLHLPGIAADSAVAGVAQANSQTSSQTNNQATSSTASGDTTASKSFTSDRVALGAGVSDIELNADFTGEGASDLLLYNRAQGNLDVFRLKHTDPQSINVFDDQTGQTKRQTISGTPERVSLGDSITAAGKWGSNLDIHIGDFAGTGEYDILLYDRVVGTIQILALNKDLTIKQHVTLSDIGTGWEIYVGRLNEQRSGLFMYRRYANAEPAAVSPSGSGGPGQAQDAGSSNTSNSQPAAKPTQKPQPKPKPTSTPTSQPKPTPTPTPKPATTAGATPTTGATPTATPTVIPTPTPTAIPTVVPTPTVAPTAVPTIAPTAAPTAVPTVAPTAAPTAVPTVAPKAAPTAIPTSAPKPAPTAAPTPTPKPAPAATRIPVGTPATRSTTHPTTGIGAALTSFDPQPTATATAGSHDLSGSALDDWERQGRSANILILDFNADFSVHHSQQYTLWHANWEVYTGRFANSNQDGIFLYDRSIGEGRLMDFDANLLVSDYQEMHGLAGNWVVYSGDFTNSGRAQLLLYDPSSSKMQFLTLKADLSVASQKVLSNVGANMVLYVGHFGLPNLSIMLYNPQEAKSTFIAFDTSLNIAHEYLADTWDQNWQILVGSFLDRSRCIVSGDCSNGDDILVLNRKNGLLQQFVFSFGRKFQVYDNRSQAFARQGIATDHSVNTVDTTTFSMINSQSTSIRNEELY